MENEKKDVEQNEDEIKEMFKKTLQQQDEKSIIEEEEAGPKEINTHHAEIFSPIAVLVVTSLSFIADFFYASFIAIFIGIVGLIVCKRKATYLNNKVLLLNIIVTAIAFFVSCLWVMVIILGS